MEISPYRRALGWALSSYAMLVWRTGRYEVHGQAHVDRAGAAGRPIILAAWHGLTMMMTGYIADFSDPSRYVIIVPDDPRGTVLSVWARRMGATPLSISMEADSMVAGRRLLALIRQMRPKGAAPGVAPSAVKNLYLNPDGPDGPTHEPKRGVAFIARKAGALIVPAGAFTATCLHVPRWDRYVVPLPFSRIVIALREPLAVPPKADLEQARLEIRERLSEAERAAERIYRTRRSDRTPPAL